MTQEFYRPKNGYLICKPIRATNQEAQYVIRASVESSSSNDYGRGEVILFRPAEAVSIGQFMAVHEKAVITEIVEEDESCQESPQKNAQTKKGGPSRTRPVTATSRPSA